MSRHEGVSCDVCLKGNFSGRRYKCLICYDYDLCANCYETQAQTSRHSPDHAMQCIITRTDFDLYYNGENVGTENPQSFTCPFCARMGYTETSLLEHCNNEHPDNTTEVVCPICAALPGGEPNHVTDDFSGHLTIEHRNSRPDMDADLPGLRHIRRAAHAQRPVSSRGARRAGPGIGYAPAAVSGSSNGNSSATGGAAAVSSLLGQQANRDAADPIADLFSQLTGVRRALIAGTPHQLRDLQQQLDRERQQARAIQQQLERIPRGQEAADQSSMTKPATSNTASSTTESAADSQFLLSRFSDSSLSDKEESEACRLERQQSLFVQDLVMSALSSTLPDLDSLTLEAPDTATRSRGLSDDTSGSVVPPTVPSQTPRCRPLVTPASAKELMKLKQEGLKHEESEREKADE